MAIRYDKLFQVLDSKNMNKNYLRKNGIHANTVDRLIHNQSINTDVLNRICRLLNCQPGDILEYVPDEESQESNDSE